jgi:hypothetical protein
MWVGSTNTPDHPAKEDQWKTIPAMASLERTVEYIMGDEGKK